MPVAAEFRFQHDYEIPVSYLAKRVADHSQVFTQHPYMHPLVFSFIILGLDEETGPKLCKRDPAGYHVSYSACAAGTKDQEAEPSKFG